MISLSVVVPVRNGAEFIRASLIGLLESPYVMEILIADGSSDDETISVIEDMKNSRVRIVSRSDSGIYNGANKALAACRGDFILFMNSNDVFRAAYIDAALKSSHPDEVDFYYGNISMGGRVVRPRLRSPEGSSGAWQLMPFPHVSLIVRRSVHAELAGYEEQFRIASDLDYVNRLLQMNVRGAYVDAIAADCLRGGVSSGFAHVFEARKVAIKNGRSALAATVIALLVILLRVFRR